MALDDFPFDLEEELAGALLELLGFRVETKELPGGLEEVLLSRRNVKAELLEAWAKEDSKPNTEGETEVDVITRREKLFETLRDLDSRKVIELAIDYFQSFPDHPGLNIVIPDEFTGAVATPLSNLEDFTFDPDRMVAMCKALQDAVRKVSEVTDGTIYVVEAGYGLGFVALSALALNEELDGRVHVIGLESNLASLHRASQILGYYGVDPSWVTLRDFDATSLQGIPEDTHILVAEHLNTGVFSLEPLTAIHQNIIPQLSEPFYVIPDGIEIYGRVVSTETYTNLPDLKALLDKGLKKTPGKDTIEEADLRALTRGANKELIQAQLLTRVKFAEALDEIWDGMLDLTFEGTPSKSGRGVIELRSVPTFHTDTAEEPVLRDFRFYLMQGTRINGGKPMYIHGTSLNHWGHLRDQDRIDTFLHSREARRDPHAAQFAVYEELRFSPISKYRRGKNSRIHIEGPIAALGAKVSIDTED